jgi:hypothetical protein
MTGWLMIAGSLVGAISGVVVLAPSVMAVALLAIIFTVSEVGLQGVVSPARLQANSDSALVYVAQALGRAPWTAASPPPPSPASSSAFYYRHRIVSNVGDAVLVGILPVGAVDR